MAIVTTLPAAQRRLPRCTDERRFPPHRALHARLAQPLPWSLPVPEPARDLHVKVASTRAEWEEAFRLVADNYQARGYETPEAAEFRFSSYHVLPDTVTF